ncbi:uncharacterized protein [Atheta coriaria]|uniref:uncharacterized protein n=1 Tax=Dalotia coriaria TaxID=877792 RepID=UPI0031F43849
MDRKSRAKRVSILKPPKVDLTEEVEATKVNHKVRFSSNFVKEFVPVTDGDHHTLWDATYEEEIEKSSTLTSHSQLSSSGNVSTSTSCITKINSKNVLQVQQDKNNVSNSNFSIDIQNDAKRTKDFQSPKDSVPSFVKKAAARNAKKQKEQKTQPYDQNTPNATISKTKSPIKVDSSNVAGLKAPHHSQFRQELSLDPLSKTIDYDNFCMAADNITSVADSKTVDNKTTKRNLVFNSTQNDISMIDTNHGIISPIYAHLSKSRPTTNHDLKNSSPDISFSEAMDENKLVSNQGTNESKSKNRYTIHFTATAEDAKMDLTMISETNSKTQLFGDSMEETRLCGERTETHFVDNHGTQICTVPSEELNVFKNDLVYSPQMDNAKSQNRRTIYFNAFSKDAEMNLTTTDENDCKTTVFNIPMDETGLCAAETGIEVHPEIFQPANMNLSKVAEPHSKTCMSNNPMQETTVETLINVGSKSKVKNSILFNSTSQDAEMDFTNININHATKSFNPGLEKTGLLLTQAETDLHHFITNKSQVLEINDTLGNLHIDLTKSAENNDETKRIDDILDKLGIELSANLKTDKNWTKNNHTIYFNTTSADAEMEETKFGANDNKTQLFNFSMDETGLYMAGKENDLVHTENDNLKAQNVDDNNIKTQLLNVPMDETKSQTRTFDVQIDKIRHKIETDLFENPETDIGVAKNWRTIHFNATSPNAEMDETKLAEKNSQIQSINIPMEAIRHETESDLRNNAGTEKENEQKRHTIYFNTASQDAEMDVTKLSDNNSRIQMMNIPLKKIGLGTETDLYDNAETDKCKAQNRYTIHFNASSPDAKMDETKLTENNSRIQMLNIPKKKIGLGTESELYDNAETDKCKAPNRYTIHFNATCPDAEMDETKLAESNFNIPSINIPMEEIGHETETDVCNNADTDKTSAQKRHTIYFNAASQDAEMEVTKLAENSFRVPIRNIPVREIGLGTETDLYDNAETDKCKAQNRYTIHFNATSPHAEMDETKLVGNTSKIQLINTPMEEVRHETETDLCNNAGTEKESTQKRRTIYFNAASQDAEMEVTKLAENNSKIQMLSVPMKEIGLGTDTDLSDKCKAQNRYTIHFNATSPDAKMDETKLAENNSNIQLTHIPMEEIRNETGTDLCGNVETGKGKASNRYTIHFNATSPDAEMDETKVAENNFKLPSINIPMEEIRHDTEIGLCNNAGTEKESAQKRHTIYFNVASQDAKMDETKLAENNSRLQLVNNPIEEFRLETGADLCGNGEIEKGEARKRYTIHFNAISPNADMDETQVVENNSIIQLSDVSMVETMLNEAENEMDVIPGHTSDNSKIEINHISKYFQDEMSTILFTTPLIGAKEDTTMIVENSLQSEKKSISHIVNAPNSKSPANMNDLNVSRGETQVHVADTEIHQITDHLKADVTMRKTETGNCKKQLFNIHLNEISSSSNTNNFKSPDVGSVKYAMENDKPSQSGHMYVEDCTNDFAMSGSSNYNKPYEGEKQASITEINENHADKQVEIDLTLYKTIEEPKDASFIVIGDDSISLISEMPPIFTPDKSNLDLKRCFDLSPASVEKQSKRVDIKNQDFHIKSTIAQYTTTKRYSSDSPYCKSKIPAKKMDLKETPIKISNILQSYPELNVNIEDDAEEIDIDELRIQNVDFELEVDGIANRELLEARRQSTKAQLDALESLEAECRRYLKCTTLRGQQLRDELENLKLVDIQKIHENRMSLVDKVQQKAKSHNEYQINQISEESVQLLVFGGEFELTIQIQKDTGLVLSFDVNEPCPKPDSHALLKWMHHFFHHKMDPRSIQSYIGSNFSILSLLDYLELQLGEFSEIFVSVFNSMILYNTRLDDKYQLSYRYFTSRMDVEITLDLSQFNMEKVLVAPIIREGPARMKKMLEIINTATRDNRFPLNCIRSLHEFFESFTSS